MGIGIFLENQIHERELASQEVADALDQLICVAPREGRLRDIFEYGDTMFNIPQLQKIDTEILGIMESRADMRQDGELIRGVIDSIIRRRGYMWVSGD